MQTTICVRAKKATDSRQAAYPGEAERGKYVASQIHETEGLFDWSDSSIAWAAITWLSDFSHAVDSILTSDQWKSEVWCLFELLDKWMAKITFIPRDFRYLLMKKDEIEPGN